MPPDETTRLIDSDVKAFEGPGGLGPSVRQVVIAGTGFLADAYDLFVIDLVIAILRRLHPGGIGPAEKSLVAAATLIGAVAGQVVFGVLGDWLGRKWTFLVTCFLIVFGALGSSCVVWNSGPFSLVLQLALCRFLLGVGVGGEYPLAATIAAESSDRVTRGRLLATVFSMQGWGMLLSCVLTLLMLLCGLPLETTWRALLALGAVPSAAVIYLRAKMEETSMFQQAHASGENCAAPSLSGHISRSWAVLRKFWRPMVGTTMTWFLLDVTFYGTGSFKSQITAMLLESKAETAREEVWHEAVLALIIVCMAIPGYILSIFFIEKIGRYRLQLGGFVAMSLLFLLVACLHNVLVGGMRWLLIIFFGLTFLFSNLGPNTTTFIIPVEVYPTIIRATCHGLSAAAGKVGAVLGAAAFAPMDEALGLEAVLVCCGAVAFLGALFTFYFTSDEVLDLAELDKATGAHA